MLLKQLELGGLGVIFDLNFVLSFIIESIVISRKLILQVREVMTSFTIIPCRKEFWTDFNKYIVSLL